MYASYEGNRVINCSGIRIEAALQEGDFQTVSRDIEALVSVPDYIVLPTAIYRRPGAEIAPYVRETDIGAYTVLRRQE